MLPQCSDFCFHMNEMKNSLMLFYYCNIFDTHYILWVDKITSIVVHENPLWPWLLPVNINLCSGLFSGDRCGWRSINIQKQICTNIVVKKICNAHKIIDLTYYWPACGIKISDDWFLNSLKSLLQQFEFHNFQQVIFYQTDYSYFEIRMHHYICFVDCHWSWTSLNLIQSIWYTKTEIST